MAAESVEAIRTDPVQQVQDIEARFASTREQAIERFRDMNKAWFAAYVDNGWQPSDVTDAIAEVSSKYVSRITKGEY